MDKNVKSIDLHTPMKNYLEQGRKEDSSFTITRDGVHPTHLGHLLIAEIILNGVGVQVDFPNLDEELKKMEADTLFKLIDEQRQTRSKGWLDYIGYTKEKAVKSNDIKSTVNKVVELQEKINSIRREGKNK